MEKIPVSEEAVESSTLPTPPPDVPPDVKPEHLAPTKYNIVNRCGVGTAGKCILLLANHFRVSIGDLEAIFFQYSVTITSEDKRAVESKGIGRKVIDRLYQTYSFELDGKKFAYDGEKTLYTVGPLPCNYFNFPVVVEKSFAKCTTGSPGADGSPRAEIKRSKLSFQSKTFNVEISFAAKIPLQSAVLSLEVVESDAKAQDTLRVLDVILRQQAANRGCLLVRQSFFHDDSRNFTDVGGGVTGVHGFHSSFRPTQDGLSLNMECAGSSLY